MSPQVGCQERARLSLFAACTLATVQLLACGGGSRAGATGGKPDGSGGVASPDGSIEAGVVDAVAGPPDASADAVDALRADTQEMPPPEGPPPAVVPLPADLPPPRRIFDRDVVMTGDGRSSCSHGELTAAGGATLCAFALPAAQGPNLDLHVLDLAAAAAGQPVICDGSRPICRKVHEQLWLSSPLGGPSHPFAHAFDGDTLIIFGATTTALRDLHAGPIFAWRPGWAASRLISGPMGLLCRGHASAAVAYCLDDVRGDPARPESVELRAGSLVDGPSGQLPVIERFRPLRSDGTSDWQVGFTQAGAHFVITSPDPDPAVTTLRTVATREAGSKAPTPLAQGVGSWRSGAGETIHYLGRDADRGLFRLDLTNPTPQRLLTDVRAFDYVGTRDRRAIVVDSGVGSSRGYRLLGETANGAPPTTLLLAASTPEAVRVAPDLRHTAWVANDFVGQIVRHTDGKTCLLATSGRAEVFNVGFAGADLIFWSEGAGQDQERNDGYFAPRDDCRGAVRFARAVHLMEPVAGGIVFADDYDASHESMSLKFARTVSDGGRARLGRAVRIAEGVHQYATVIGDDPAYVLFRTTSRSPLPPGFYVYGPIPFSAAPVDP